MNGMTGIMSKVRGWWATPSQKDDGELRGLEGDDGWWENVIIYDPDDRPLPPAPPLDGGIAPRAPRVFDERENGWVHIHSSLEVGAKTSAHLEASRLLDCRPGDTLLWKTRTNYAEAVITATWWDYPGSGNYRVRAAELIITKQGT